MIKRIIVIFLCLMVLCTGLSAKDGTNGTIVKRKLCRVLANQEILQRMTTTKNGKTEFLPEFSYMEDVKIEEITYLSDGLKIKGFLAYPKKQGRYPGVIFNRGGNREFGALTPLKAALILGRAASWNYVVVASQYRGNSGGQGKEEFGGRDVNDVINLIPLLKSLPMADASRIGMYGWSRGGMMTYLALTRTQRIKAAVVGGGLSDLLISIKNRPQMETRVYQELIPNYHQNKEALLKARSAIYQLKKICKTTPILILHGTSDWRSHPQQALKLASGFLKVKIPFRLVIC